MVREHPASMRGATVPGCNGMRRRADSRHAEPPDRRAKIVPTGAPCRPAMPSEGIQRAG